MNGISTTRVRVSCLGAVGVEVDSQPSRSLASQRKALALVALLAVHGPTGLSRDKAIGYLWPESEEDRGRNALAQLVHRLRRELVPDCIDGAGELRFDTTLVS